MSVMFRPEIWSQALIEQMRHNLLFPGRADERTRRGHSEVTPYTKTELKARKKAIKAWQALTDEMLAKGWLEDYPYEGIFPSTETQHREWVYDETEDEHQARVAALPDVTATMTIPVHRLDANSTTIIKAATA